MDYRFAGRPIAQVPICQRVPHRKSLPNIPSWTFPVSRVRLRKDAPRKANYVTVEASGAIYLNKKQVGFDGLRAELVQLRMDDPDLNVVVRGDGRTKYRQIVRVMDLLQQANVVKVEVATEAAAPGDE